MKWKMHELPGQPTLDVQDASAELFLLCAVAAHESKWAVNAVRMRAQQVAAHVTDLKRRHEGTIERVDELHEELQIANSELEALRDKLRTWLIETLGDSTMLQQARIDDALQLFELPARQHAIPVSMALDVLSADPAALSDDELEDMRRHVEHMLRNSGWQAHVHSLSRDD